MNIEPVTWEPVGGGHYNAKLPDVVLCVSPQYVGSDKWLYTIVKRTEDAPLIALDWDYDSTEEAMKQAELKYADLHKGAQS